jgi:hypothetical protein
MAALLFFGSVVSVINGRHARKTLKVELERRDLGV